MNAHAQASVLDMLFPEIPEAISRYPLLLYPNKQCGHGKFRHGGIQPYSTIFMIVGVYIYISIYVPLICNGHDFIY